MHFRDAGRPVFISRDAELEALFDLDYHLKHVDFIFDRVFGKKTAG